MKTVYRALLPLIVFIFIFIFFLFGLRHDPKDLPSVLVGHSMPSFILNDLDGNKKSQKDFRGQTIILNVWASWCYACLHEHEELFSLSSKSNVKLVGLNYKDNNVAAKKWLADLGNPYSFVLEDLNGSLGLDLGVYGVPETFVIDKAGVIRLRLSGPLNKDIIAEKIMPLLG